MSDFHNTDYSKIALSKIIREGDLSLINSVPLQAFNGRYSSTVYRMLTGYYSKFGKVPSFDILQAAINKQMSEERAQVFNAYVDSLKQIDTSLPTKDLIEALEDIATVNVIDNHIEDLVDAASSRDVNTIKKLIKKISEEAITGNNQPKKAADLVFSSEHLKYIDCFLPTVNINTNLSGLVLISGNSGGGKSIWAMEQGLHAYKQGLNVLNLNLELPRMEYQARILSNISAIPFNEINKQDLTEAELDNLNTKWQMFFNRSNKFDIRNGRLDAEELIATIRGSHTTGLDVVILDYIQIVTSANSEEWKALQKLVRDLHDLAVELGIVIITPIQINSQEVNEKNNKINITTRGARELEFSASVWLHIHQSPEDFTNGVQRLFTIKARNGKKAVYVLIPQFAVMKFEDTGVVI